MSAATTRSITLGRWCGNKKALRKSYRSLSEAQQQTYNRNLRSLKKLLEMPERLIVGV